MIKIPNKINQKLSWFCIKANPRKERIAATQLSSMYEIETFIPRIRFKKKTSNGFIWCKENMFPGYFFARFEILTQKRMVAYGPGVSHIPMFGGTYVEINTKIIDELKKSMQSKDSIDVMEPLKVGDTTRILTGSLHGLPVQVVKLMPADQRVIILMEFLGQKIEKTFPIAELEQNRRGELRLT